MTGVKSLEQKTANQLQKELITTLLQRAGIKEKDIYRVALTNWVSKNLDLLTPSERQKYQKIIL
ncbi:MAG: hypothetical protein LBL07_17310 [Tannerella sp.]|jgi:hypothetical protein|nr:hypothetical protein [Tannerella sp.]